MSSVPRPLDDYRPQPSPVVIVERLQAMQRLETARQTTLHDVAVEASNGLPVWLAGERLVCAS